MAVNNLSITDWKCFFDSKGLPDEVIESYIRYISPLIERKVPVIFDLDHLCLLLGRNRTYLLSVVFSPSSHYREFDIPKRRGGTRHISTPYPSLLEMQYWILNNVLNKVKVSPYAHGFAKEKSIITNAKWHIGNGALLKLDIKDFFPSIKINRVVAVFQSLGYTDRVSFYLASICTCDGCLPQGAPTSPILSNIIATPLDYRLSRLCRKFNLHYTRYADDLTISGDSIPVKFIDYITEIVEEEGFCINNTKTQLFTNPGGKRIVTGVSVSGGVLQLPREYKRQLKQELHYVMEYGYQSHIQKKKIRRINYLDVLKGKVNFWLQIEPNNLFAQKAREFLYFESLRLKGECSGDGHSVIE